jgi:hypothetical protein
MKLLRTHRYVWLSPLICLFCSQKTTNATDHIWNRRYHEDFRRRSDSSSRSKDLGFLGIGLNHQSPLVIPSRRRLDETNETNSTNIDPCTLCPFGDSVGFPNKTAGYGLNETCADVDAFARELYASESAECQAVRFVSGICGCPPQEDNICRFCSGEDIPTPEYVVQSLAQFGLPAMSCQDIGLFVTQYTHDALACKVMGLVEFMCGCACTDKIQASNLLIWLTRVTGTLSIIGSMYIVWDVLRERSRTARMTVYHELMLAMSAFDIISSFAWSIGTLAVPSENAYGEPYMSRKLGGYGNDGTCTAQGFFIQLGYTCEYSLNDRSVTLEERSPCCSHIPWYTSCIQPCGTT